ncbi:RNA polymerase sigma factor [Pseudokordiimonas caeni]|uniref:RNA polymerase sigma factor n=1 Tax=Pseudokordiimonas caeni TaxID=2997908 RepID=UPI0028111633|nr:sigma-70 family RNA polymerase sigma factor [Pseudokordiimonas caeni]
MSEREACSLENLDEEIPHLSRYARSLVRDGDGSDDLLQTTLELAVRNQHRFAPGTNLRRWLFTIMRNAHIDNRRKLARRGHHVPIEDWYHEVHCAPSQEKRIELLEVVSRLKDLRREEQRVIQLSIFNGWPHDRIARQMGIAVGTVKSRLSRARRNLHAG